jgi:opacity protein-like surface antigen
MRKLIVLPLMIASACAGTPSAKVVVAPAPAPYLYQWFAGGTGGYLVDNETGFYSGHVGTSLNHSLFGWNASTFLEVGYFEIDEHDRYFEGGGNGGVDTTSSEKDNEVVVTESESDDFRSLRADLDVIPVSLNYKLERQIGNSVSLYIGVGVGAAFVDLDTNYAGSDDDVVFFAQAFTGVIYNVSEAFEVFAGGRAIYLDNPSFSLRDHDFDIDDSDVDLDDFDGLVELGARYNF